MQDGQHVPVQLKSMVDLVLYAVQLTTPPKKQTNKKQHPNYTQCVHVWISYSGKTVLGTLNKLDKMLWIYSKEEQDTA